jgi:hypothetical protein
MSKESTADVLPAPASAEPQTPARGRRFVIPQLLQEEVDPALATWPLVAYCFITGWMCASSLLFASCIDAHNIFQNSDVTSFSALFVWCAFQTGNTLQVR